MPSGVGALRAQQFLNKLPFGHIEPGKPVGVEPRTEGGGFAEGLRHLGRFKIGSGRGVGAEDEPAAEALRHADDVSVGEGVAGRRAQFEAHALFGGEFGVFRGDQAWVGEDVHARADGGEVRSGFRNIGEVLRDAFPVSEDQRCAEFAGLFHGVGQQRGRDVDEFHSGEGFDACVERAGSDQRHERGQQDRQRRNVRPDDPLVF